MLLEATTVRDVKALVQRAQGVAAKHQLLRFAGRHLAPDDARLMGDLGLDAYSLAQEVRQGARAAWQRLPRHSLECRGGNRAWM